MNEEEKKKKKSMQIFIDFNVISSSICVSSRRKCNCYYEDKTNKNTEF